MIKVNIGSGDDYRQGWLNVDLVNYSYYEKRPLKVDLLCNIKNGLPLADNSVDQLLIQEVFEHFNRHDGLLVLKEIHRVLKIGGVVELTVPPSEKQMKLFLLCMSKPTTIDEFLNAHESPYNVWKALDDVAGATHPTMIGNRDIGDAMSHKSFYSKSMLSMLFAYVGFHITQMDDSIRVFATKK